MVVLGDNPEIWLKEFRNNRKIKKYITQDSLSLGRHSIQQFDSPKGPLDRQEMLTQCLYFHPLIKETLIK
jgi:hypothetical protein